MKNTITLQRHGSANWFEKTLDNGVYISIKTYQFEKYLVEIYKEDMINIRETFKTNTGAKLFIEEYCNITINDEIEAYIVNRSNHHTEDVYHAAAIFCEYSQTFRTPISNYCIAALNEDGSLDFSWKDKAIEHIHIPNIARLQNHAKWTHNRKDTDHVWTAWLLSEYMKETGRYTTKKTTVGKMQQCSVNAL